MKKEFNNNFCKESLKALLSLHGANNEIFQNDQGFHCFITKEQGTLRKLLSKRKEIEPIRTMYFEDKKELLDYCYKYLLEIDKTGEIETGAYFLDLSVMDMVKIKILQDYNNNVKKETLK